MAVNQPIHHPETFREFRPAGWRLLVERGVRWVKRGGESAERGGIGDGRLTQVPCGSGDLRQNAERGNLSALLFTRGSRGSRLIEKAPR